MIGGGLPGYGWDGMPLWLYSALMYYSTSPSDQKRIDRRLIRMIKVLKGRAPYTSPGEWGDRTRAGDVHREQRKEIWALEIKCAKLTEENDELRARLKPGPE